MLNIIFFFTISKIVLLMYELLEILDFLIMKYKNISCNVFCHINWCDMIQQQNLHHVSQKIIIIKWKITQVINTWYTSHQSTYSNPFILLYYMWNMKKALNPNPEVPTNPTNHPHPFPYETKKSVHYIFSGNSFLEKHFFLCLFIFSHLMCLEAAPHKKASICA